jgi:hypothetical protein
MLGLGLTRENLFKWNMARSSHFIISIPLDLMMLEKWHGAGLGSWVPRWLIHMNMKGFYFSVHSNLCEWSLIYKIDFAMNVIYSSGGLAIQCSLCGVFFGFLWLFVFIRALSST